MPTLGVSYHVHPGHTPSWASHIMPSLGAKRQARTLMGSGMHPSLATISPDSAFKPIFFALIRLSQFA